MSRRLAFALFMFAAFSLLAPSVRAHPQEEGIPPHLLPQDDGEFFLEGLEALGCVRANSSQIEQVTRGNRKKSEFLAACSNATGGSAWCNQLVRPNPSSVNTFRCTYGSELPHQLIHPDESTWKHAFAAVNIIKDLTGRGMKVCQIYNWWRPEPYNNNVGGAAGRHPYGTSVDVRFCSNSDANKAFSELCKMRRAGRLRAIGHYGSSALHLGIGDRVANTWGKSCPSRSTLLGLGESGQPLRQSRLDLGL